jgi:hypothetical protein
MDRREALKRIGLSFGVLVGGPTAFSVLQGCSNTATKTAWKPQFFSEDEASFITKTVDIILPATGDTPSASEVNVPQFIDKYMFEVIEVEEQQLSKEYLGNIIEKMKKDTGKSDAASFTQQDIEPLIANSLSKTREEEEKIVENLDNYIQAKQEGKQTKLFGEVASFAFLTNLRGLAIWSYKTSETVGEDILAYEQIPGQQKGCVSVQEATGGKAWSL